ncbi:hypothetical protein RBSH_02946 [Rhodopirellula baltica SH28]|uniref:Uncharacterized protein n=1 Tax=Rhodopirellula baltica SH28 TaxID=993517 RepID=K5D512_RHOBT|nr:hypothetical protein RBSH_02946 [Rhodopirellula baltica SH28]
MLKMLSGIIEQAWRGGASRSSSAPGRSPRQPFFSRLRAKYDAANTTLDNMKHWSRADGLSSAAANSPDVRRTLRKRTPQGSRTDAKLTTIGESKCCRQSIKFF